MLENRLYEGLSSDLKSVNNLYSPEQDMTYTIYKELGTAEVNTEHQLKDVM
jgi:hypothetical protein